MKKRLLMALVLTGGIALAQTGNSTGSAGQNQNPAPQAQPVTPDQQQQPASPATTDQSNANSQNTATNASSGGQETVVRGCLKQSGGNWTISENGQDTTLNGDRSLLKPHDGQQVEVRGMKSGNTLKVTSVNTISDSCTSGGQAASTSVTTHARGF